MDAKLIMTVEQMQDREAWLAKRMNGIGGSDASVILGMKAGGAKYKLWTEKLGLEKPKDLSDVERVHFGQVHEQTVADEFELRTGKKLKKCGLYQSKEKPWMLASIDRLVVGENAALECKTTASYLGFEWDGDNIPDAYFAQCLHYMAVCGFDTMYIACLIGGNHFVWKEIRREDVLDELDALVEAEENFWKNYIETKTPPPVDETRECTNFLNKRFTIIKEKDVAMLQMDSKMEEKCKQIKILDGVKKETEKNIDQLKNEIRELMGEYAYAEGGNYRATYKFQNGNPSFNKEQFLADHPEITDFDKYYNHNQSRVLRITPIKKKKI